MMQNTLLDAMNFHGDAIVAEMADFNHAQQFVIASIVNTKLNKSLLQHMPHKKFLDLSIVYHIVVEQNHDYSSRIPITNQMVKVWGIDIEQLHEIAMRNTRKTLGATVTSLASTLEQISGIEIDNSFSVFHSPIIVVTNEYLSHGAIHITDIDVMNEVAETLETNKVMLIPSSVHELLALPYEEGAVGTVKESILHVNQHFIRPKEILSNNLYLFDSKEGKITIV
jgi:hypothetical protein